MALDARLQNFITAVGTSFKTLRNSVGDLTSLTTTVKTNLVSAINEVRAMTLAAGSGDMLKATYDSNNNGKVDSAESVPWTGITGLPATFAPSAHTHPSSAVTYSVQTTGVNQPTTVDKMLDSILYGYPTGVSNEYPVRGVDNAFKLGGVLFGDYALKSDVSVAVATVKNEILGGAGAAYDTLSELQALLQGDAASITALNTAIGNRVRFDASQTLTTPQKTQALSNIGAASTADVATVQGSVNALSAAVGNTEQDLVAAWNTAIA